MKVLFINVNCKVGSTGKIVYDLYTSVNQSGNEAAICYGRGFVVRGKNIYKFGLDCETYLHALLTRITGFTGCFSFFSTKRLLRFIEDYKPDVIHIHELHAYFVNIKLLIEYIKRKNIKVIYTFHCEFAYTGKCGYAYECDSWKTECGHCPLVRDYPKSLLFDHSKYMFNQKKKLFSDWNNLTIVTPSLWLAGRVKQSFLKDKRIETIPNSVDTNIFYPRDTRALRAKLALGSNEKVVLAVAPRLMSDRKGGKYILKLAEAFKDKLIKFIMIGVDKEKVEHGDNVIIMHRIQNQDELAMYYSLADLFVICSKRENFPTTCIEAQCCGTPICGFDTGGTQETAIDSGKRFVPYNDMNQLQNIVQNCLDQDLKGQLHVEEQALTFFSKKRMGKKYMSLYFN